MIAAGLVALTAGCGGAPRDAHELRIAWSSDPATLDPAQAVDVVGGNAVSLLHAGLVLFDRDGAVAPGLAESWRLSEDGRTLTFRIRDGAAASDGSPLGAEEAAASFRRLLDPQEASPRSWVLEGIRGATAFRNGEAADVAGLRVESPRDLVIELEKPSASFLSLLAMPSACVLPAGCPVDGRVATGPWVLEEWVRDGRLVFRRNPHWYGEAPAFETLRVRILPEDFTRAAEFEVGSLDLLEVPAAESARLHAEMPDRVMRQVALVTEYVGLNNDDPVLGDVRVRRALNHAVNVERILENVLGGLGVRSVGAVPPGLPGGGAGTLYEWDPERAKELLREAGVPEDWTLTLWQRPSPLASQVLEAVQADLAAVGVDARIRVRDWSALKAAVDQGETAAFFINWYADYPDPENFLVPLFHSANVGGGGNRARFRDAGVDSLLDRLERPAAPEERSELAAGIDRRVSAQAPWIYLWHPVKEIAVSERIRGYRPHPISTCERWLGVSAADAAGGTR